ncbi:putative DNA-binding pseudobarrel domain superfamily [Helianthus debilis subsp. tardiflorus]
MVGRFSLRQTSVMPFCWFHTKVLRVSKYALRRFVEFEEITGVHNAIKNEDGTKVRYSVWNTFRSKLAAVYFPPINQSEGVPLKIWDIKGKEWTFQFRFWPNNNSCMYVLEGVNPCIQNMQLEAGDTGCRKATVLADAPALPNPVNGGALTCTDNGNLPTNMTQEGTSNWDSVQSSEKKKTRNIGSKSKRLHMHSEDALELKFTWEEAQQYLHPPISKPTAVTIENCELEEYDAPPVFGNKTMFTSNADQ